MIKSFKQRAEKLEMDLGESLNINGKFSEEFEEWLRDNRNRDYELTDTEFKNLADIVKRELDKRLKEQYPMSESIVNLLSKE